jgi:hypothetical protein
MIATGKTLRMLHPWQGDRHLPGREKQALIDFGKILKKLLPRHTNAARSNSLNRFPLAECSLAALRTAAGA